MLGDMILETTGKTIVRRVLSTEPLTVEVSYEDTGKVLGISTTGFGTYISAIRPDGSVIAEGQGVFMAQDGALVTWKGSAQGTFKEKGAASYRGIHYYRTTSQTFARLNAAPGVFEVEVDPEGRFTGKAWELK